MRDHPALPSTEVLVRRILRTFDTASPSDIEAGARWYDEAAELALMLAPDAGGIEVAAEVIAALSPRTFWSRNVTAAVLLVTHGERLAGMLGRNLDTAERILKGETGVLKGNKTRAFAANIAGDRERVTVDVWAARAVGVEEEMLTRKGIYDAVERAYRLAARRRGVDPATMQATVWVITRRAGLSAQRRAR